MGEPWWKLQDFDDPVGNHGNLRVATPSLSGKWPYDRGLLGAVNKAVFFFWGGVVGAYQNPVMEDEKTWQQLSSSQAFQVPTLLETNSSPLKTDGWKMILCFWGV